jgi:hypothetical protein
MADTGKENVVYMSDQVDKENVTAVRVRDTIQLRLPVRLELRLNDTRWITDETIGIRMETYVDATTQMIETPDHIRMMTIATQRVRELLTWTLHQSRHAQIDHPPGTSTADTYKNEKLQMVFDQLL